MNNQRILIELDVKAREIQQLALQLQSSKEEPEDRKAFDTYRVRIAEKVLSINQDIKYLIKRKSHG